MASSRRNLILFGVLCALAGALLFYVVRPPETLPPEYAVGTLVLTKKQIEKDAPTGKISLLGHVTKKQAKKTLNAVAPNAASSEATAFANAVRAVLATDTPVSKPDSADLANGETPLPPPAAAAPLCFHSKERYSAPGLFRTSGTYEVWSVCSDLAERRERFVVNGGYESVAGKPATKVITHRLSTKPLEWVIMFIGGAYIGKRFL